MSNHKKPEHHIRPYKIAAQTAGLIACIFILFFIAGNGASATMGTKESALKPFLPFLILPVIGYILSWFKELAGTLIMTAGGIVLLIFFRGEGDNAMALIYGLPFILAGMLFFVHISKRNKLRKGL